MSAKKIGAKAGKAEGEEPQKLRQAEEVDVSNFQQAVGRYYALWRNESKQVAKLLEVDGDEMVYEMVSGPDKGKVFRAHYFAKTIQVFDDDNLILALIE